MVVSVVIADAHGGQREGLAGVEGVSVLAEVSTEHDIAGEVLRHRPDVLVIDPLPAGLLAIREVVSSAPSTNVLVFSEHWGDDALFGALHAGARGYLLKSASRADLVRAVHAVAAGSAVFGGPVARRLNEALVVPGVCPVVPSPLLTRRQQEILTLLAAGLPVSAIAQRLCLTPKTVRNHSSAIFAKLGVRDRVSAASLAKTCGLTGP